MEKIDLCQKAKDMFQAELKIPILAKSEIYAGKILAALDRQHPRDLFDVYMLYKHDPAVKNGLPPEFIEDFIGYLCSHNRTFTAILDGKFKDISKAFENEFSGMTQEKVSLDDLLEAREKLREDILNKLTERDKSFLLSFAKGEPKWNEINSRRIENMPAVLWKLKNLEDLKAENPESFEKQVNDLSALFWRYR